MLYTQHKTDDRTPGSRAKMLTLFPLVLLYFWHRIVRLPREYCAWKLVLSAGPYAHFRRLLQKTQPPKKQNKNILNDNHAEFHTSVCEPTEAFELHQDFSACEAQYLSLNHPL